VLPIRVSAAPHGDYLLRVDPARKGEVLAAAEPTLDKVSPNRIILKRQTFAEIRDNFFKADRAMAYLLVGVSLALLVITALGVVGLASFWVQQRTRQIGVRRALGATRGDILRYFQLENFILASAGIVLGMAPGLRDQTSGSCRSTRSRGCPSSSCRSAPASCGSSARSRCSARRCAPRRFRLRSRPAPCSLTRYASRCPSSS